MHKQTLDEFRQRRLADALRQRFDGNKAALGRALGYKNGAFVRQMLAGERTVSEKTVLAFEKIPGMQGWFDVTDERLQDFDACEQPPATAKAAPTLEQALPVVLELVTAATEVTRPAIVAALHRLLDDPAQLDKVLPLLDLLRMGAPQETATFVKPKART